MNIQTKAIEATGIVNEKEDEWLSTATKNPVFDFLKEPAEDIYKVSDGSPFKD